jgi:hypothetical protein
MPSPHPGKKAFDGLFEEEPDKGQWKLRSVLAIGSMADLYALKQELSWCSGVELDSIKDEAHKERVRLRQVLYEEVRESIEEKVEKYITYII